MVVINVTSLWNELNRLNQMQVDTYALMEASVPAAKHRTIKCMALSKGFQLELTDTDPENVKDSVGVAIMVREPNQLRKLKMTTEKGNDAQKMGRLIKGAVHGSKAGTYHVIVGYGWANSDTNKEKAWRTNNLVTAALLEEKDLCQTPTFFVGDLNANIETLPALVDALQHGGGWI